MSVNISRLDFNFNANLEPFLLKIWQLLLRNRQNKKNPSGLFIPLIMYLGGMCVCVRSSGNRNKFKRESKKERERKGITNLYDRKNKCSDRSMGV